MKGNKNMNKLKAYTKKILPEPSTFLNPVPVVMVSCCGISPDLMRDNIITIAWTGTINSTPPMLSVSIRKSRFSHAQIMESQEFVVNLVNEDLLQACDFCGVKSGKDLDKFETCQLKKEKAPGLDHTSAIANSPVSMSCKVRQIIELGSHDLFLAEIISVSAAEELFKPDGSIHFDLVNLVVYSHGKYQSLSEPQGFFGYSVASSKVLKKRMNKRK
jgi:flavin reductase (DIM6/NTAB) family NADH-FMN oxidoreductase RutF